MGAEPQNWLDWFSQQDFMPHGHCYLWKDGLVYTHVISDLLIGLAYVSISLTLYALVKKIKLPFSAIVLSFGLFIGACGLTHFMEIWNLWHADYWYSAWVKVLTAIASVSTGIYLYQLRHPIYLMAEAAKLSEQRRIDLEKLTHELGQRVEQRTSELTESEGRFKQISELMPQMVWTTNADGSLIYFNKRWYEFTGLSEHQSQGWGWQTVLHPDDLERTSESWRRSLKTGEPYNIECRMKNSSGVYRWQLTRAVPLRNSRGETTQWFGTCTDIEDQKMTQNALREAVLARDNFLSIASHELNTPLTSLRLQSQLQEKKLQEGLLQNEDVRKYLSIVNRQTERLSHLVNDMLDVSRVQSGKLALKLSEKEAGEIVKETVDRFIAEGMRIRLHTNGRFPVNVDAFRIEQVLVNLLTNAKKYAPKSDVAVNVLPGNQNCVRIELKDAGPGIEPEHLKKIFTRFERGVSPNDVSGLGLGLYISQQIIDAHHGRIWAESEVGKGATFIIELPVIREQE